MTSCECQEVLFVFTVGDGPVTCGYCQLPVDPEKVPFNLRSTSLRPRLRVIKGGKEE